MVYPQIIREKMEARFFFNFRSKLSSANARVAAIELDLEPDPNGVMEDDHTKLIKGQYEGIHFPVVFKQKHKGKFNDVLDTEWPGLYLISEKFKKIAEENELTGWQVFPVRLYDLKRDEIFGYYGFSIVGQCGSVSYAQSEILEKRWVPHGPFTSLLQKELQKFCKKT